MMYSDRAQWAFIHVPKAAGTSVRNALSRFDDTANLYWGPRYVPELGRTIDKAHVQAHELHAFPDLEARIAKYPTFALVRDPLDRFISAYNYTVQRGYVKETVPALLDLFAKYPTLVTTDMRFIHFVPQHQFLFRPNGKCVADHIVQNADTDRLVDLMQAVCGIDIVIGQANESLERKLEIGHLDQHVIDRIQAMYAKDYTLLIHDVNHS